MEPHHLSKQVISREDGTRLEGTTGIMWIGLCQRAARCRCTEAAAAEAARGFEPPAFADVRLRRSVRAPGFNGAAFEKTVAPERYRWLSGLGNACIETRESGAHRHLRGARVLQADGGGPLTQKMVQDHMRRAVRRAGLAHRGIHVLRHSFCSHLAMRGAPVRAIQELAGHQDLTTTQRSMHLSPTAVADAIRLLDQPNSAPQFGDMLETGSTPT